jgi:dinuclear metal center YbgI/SA1388 family protein
MTLAELDNYLRETLRLSEYQRVDASMNGVQVGRREKEVHRVAVAVDAARETIQRAAEWDADVLLVHHGLFWGQPLAVTGRHYERVKALLDADTALYAVHLPLDSHEELGNNAVMARKLGLQDLRPFGTYKGVDIGWAGSLSVPLSAEAIARTLFGSVNELLGLLPFGDAENRNIGIVSGGGIREVAQAIDDSLDLFITGDASHTVYHDCLEAGINVMFAGHYNTETWGVRAVASRLSETFDLETTFIDLPTGL